MKFVINISILFFTVGHLVFTPLLAQETEETPTDDLGDVSDAFQEHFFEALKQKGIENYELALESLKRAFNAAQDNPSNIAVLDFESGKNLIQLKRYEEAETALLAALKIKGERQDILEAIYDLYYQQRDFEAAIPWVEKLLQKDDDYKEDLSNLYFQTKRYSKALEVLDELDQSWGESVYRDSLRRQIYKITGNSDGAIQNLESKIVKNPKNEQDYLNLIYLYSQEGNTEKAFELAQQLQKQIPSSEKVHMALYKYYLEQGNIAKAVQSIETIFGSNIIETESKFMVLSDYLNHIAAHPEDESTLDHLLPLLSNSNDGSIYQKIGLYFLSKKKQELALQFYEKGTSLDPDNFSLLKNTLLLQIDSHKWEAAAALSEERLALFPAQAVLYLLNGVANNKLNKPNEALTSLETGIDFLLDDPKMEKDFYLQMAEAYQLLGKKAKFEEFQKRAMQIQISNRP